MAATRKSTCRWTADRGLDCGVWFGAACGMCPLGASTWLQTSQGCRPPRFRLLPPVQRLLPNQAFQCDSPAAVVLTGLSPDLPCICACAAHMLLSSGYHHCTMAVSLCQGCTSLPTMALKSAEPCIRLAAMWGPELAMLYVHGCNGRPCFWLAR